MKPSTERAFQVADKVSRILGDYKHSTWILASRRDLSDKEKLQVLDTYHSEQLDALKLLSNEISNAMFDLNSDTSELFEEHKSISAQGEVL